MDREIIDIIPIKLNEEIPSNDKFYHIEYISNQYRLEEIVYRINRELKNKNNFDYLILLKEGKVISIL